MSFPDIPQHDAFLNALEQGRWGDLAIPFIDRFVDAETAYIDVGGWIGVTPFWAAQKARNVITVEPDPECLRILEAMNALNQHRVAVKHAAISTHDTLTLAAVDGFGSSMTSALATGSQSITVAGVTLADIIAEAGGSNIVLKIDIEGYEFEILDQLEALDPDTIRAVMIAMHPRFLVNADSGGRLQRRWRAARKVLAVVRAMRRFRLENPSALAKLLFSLVFQSRVSFRDLIFVPARRR